MCFQRLAFASLCLLIPILLNGCGTGEPVVDTPSLAAWQNEKPDDAFGAPWMQLIANAQAEGELVVVLGTARTRSYRLLLEAFTNKFDIRIVTTPGGSAVVTQRLLAERRQGRFTSDVVMISPGSMERLAQADALMPLEPLFIHPEVVDRSHGWLPVGQTWLGQTPGTIAATALRPRANLSEIYYNSESVRAEEIQEVRSWQDLLKPHWKGRIVTVLDPNASSASYDWRRAWSVLGSTWFERFIREMEPVLLPHGSERELVNGLARGKYDLALFASRGAGLEFKQLADIGMPVKKLTRTLEEGNWASLSGAVGIFEGAPHSKAAQLFVNWYMSREGQSALLTLIQSDDPYPSLRADVPQARVADYAWNIARSLDKTAIVRPDPEWDNETTQQARDFIESICRELGCYGY